MHDIWNPWHGCTKVSEGCDRCYMYAMDRARGLDGALVRRNASTFRYPLAKNRDGSYKVRAGELIRICMTSDFFVEEADPWRAEVWDIIHARPDVRFFILTKRPERMASCLPADWGAGWKNVMLNVTAENQRRAEERIPILLATPARHRGIMCAPFLGPVDAEPYLATGKIEQVICGGENYDGARPCDFAWVQALCAVARRERHAVNVHLGRQGGEVPGAAAVGGDAGEPQALVKGPVAIGVGAEERVRGPALGKERLHAAEELPADSLAARGGAHGQEHDLGRAGKACLGDERAVDVLRGAPIGVPSRRRLRIERAERAGRPLRLGMPGPRRGRRARAAAADADGCAVKRRHQMMGRAVEAAQHVVQPLEVRIGARRGIRVPEVAQDVGERGEVGGTGRPQLECGGAVRPVDEGGDAGRLVCPGGVFHGPSCGAGAATIAASARPRQVRGRAPCAFRY